MAKESLRKCSHCGHNGHNSRTCINSINREIKLFGVKINVTDDENPRNKRDESLRKCKSMGSLGACNDENNDADLGAGYLSDGPIHLSSEAQTAHERRKGKPWSEEEHRSFLFGLEKLGKGDWKGISKNFVQSRTPTQVASHAQKYYLRITASERKKRRSSVFDLPLNEMDASSQTSPTNSSSPGATISPQVNVSALAPLKNNTTEMSGQGSITSAVKACKRPPLSPAATSHAVSDLLRWRLMLGAGSLSQGIIPNRTGAVSNVPVPPMWSFSNQKFASPTNISTAMYSYFPSMAQQSGGIFSVLPSYVPPRVATANESANKDGIDHLSVGALTL